MGEINRGLVKEQAKQIIKGKVFALFLITLIVLILVEGVSVGFSTSNGIDYLSDTFGSDNDYSNNYNYSNDYNYYGDNPIDSYRGSVTQMSKVSTTSIVPGVQIGLRSISLISLFLSPLAVTLAGLYIELIKRDPNEPYPAGENIKRLFKLSFDGSYGKKLGLYFLIRLFTTLLSFLLIVPGIVYYYSTYFANQIMCENPNLSPTEAAKLSRKMIKGSRTELFVLDLSFIPWYLLTLVTCGIASIYVLPYKKTVEALYYENFKIRALQTGKIYEDDFLSQQQKAVKYGYAPAGAPGYGQPQGYEQTNEYYQPRQDEPYYGGQNENEAPNGFNNYAQQPEYQAPFSQGDAFGEPQESENVTSGSYPSYAQPADRTSEYPFNQSDIHQDNEAPDNSSNADA